MNLTNTKSYSKPSKKAFPTAINGHQRTFKYLDNPTEQQIKEAIEQSVMTEICQYFYFEDLNNV